MIEQLVEQIRARFAELEAMMSDPAVIADRERYAEVGREYRELQPAKVLAMIASLENCSARQSARLAAART